MLYFNSLEMVEPDKTHFFANVTFCFSKTKCTWHLAEPVIESLEVRGSSKFPTRKFLKGTKVVKGTKGTKGSKRIVEIYRCFNCLVSLE